MRPLKRRTVGEIAERVDELTARVAELTRRVEFAEDSRNGGDGVRDQQADAVVRNADDSANPIEFITENGYSIIRPWESGTSPVPTGGRYTFDVCDGFIERQIAVEISRQIVTEVSLRTRGGGQLSDSFWICCAERHLVNYVSEHADFPEDDKLIVKRLSREDILLALRWDRSDE